MSKRIVWCLHCERVGPARLDADGDPECSYCGAGLGDLWSWSGPYEAGRVYEHYSDEQMLGVEGAEHDDEDYMCTACAMPSPGPGLSPCCGAPTVWVD